MFSDTVLPFDTVSSSPSAPSPVVLRFLFLGCVVSQILWSICGVKSDDFEYLYFNSELGASLFENSSDLEITCIACFASITVGFTMVIDLIVEHQFSSNSFESYDPRERCIICTFAFIPCVLPALAQHHLFYMMPYAFVLIHCLQRSAYNFVVVKILNKAYPSVFTKPRSLLVNSLYFCSTVTSLVGFDKNIGNVTNCISFLFLGAFLAVFFTLIKLVFQQQDYSRRLHENYTTREIYALNYLGIYVIYLAISLLTWMSFSCTWTNFNVLGTNALTYASILLSVSLFCIPSKAAAYRHRRCEAETSAENTVLEQSIIRHTEKITLKQDLIRYMSHEIRTPITVAKSSLAFALENLRSRQNFNFDETEDFLQDGVHACEVRAELMST